MGALLAVSLDDQAAAHLAAALEAHRRWCVTNGIAMPDAVAELQRLASSGQGRTFRDSGAPIVHDPPVPSMLLTFAECAEQIGVSARHVRRLVDQGELDAVEVSPRARRVARTDLETFVANRRRARPVGLSA